MSKINIEDLTSEEIEKIYGYTVEEYGNKYLLSKGRPVLYKIEDSKINMILSGKSASDILKMTSRGNFDYWADCYFYIAKDGLYSTNHREDHFDLYIDKKDFVKWMLYYHEDVAEQFT